MKAIWSLMHSWVMRILSSCGSVGRMRVAHRESVVRQTTGAHLAHSEGMPDVGARAGRCVLLVSELSIPIWYAIKSGQWEQIHSDSEAWVLGVRAPPHSFFPLRSHLSNPGLDTHHHLPRASHKFSTTNHPLSLHHPLLSRLLSCHLNKLSLVFNPGFQTFNLNHLVSGNGRGCW